jgi:hypothetical protein
MLHEPLIVKEAIIDAEQRLNYFQSPLRKASGGDAKERVQIKLQLAQVKLMSYILRELNELRERK